jgi:hypothetical protein
VKKITFILLLATSASLAVAAPFKTDVVADTTVDKNTLKKILHWVSVFTMYSSVDITDKVDLQEYAKAADLLQSFVQNPELSMRLNAFRKATFVNVYPKGLLNGEEWILKKLNEISDAQYSSLNPPNVTLEVWFTPGPSVENYTVTALFKTTEDKLRAAVLKVNLALSSALLGKTFAQPRMAKADVNAAIFAALDALQTAIGNTFEPNIAIHYNDVTYLNNQTIEVWQKANEGITLQAVDKDNVLLTGSLTWTGVVGSGNTVKFPIGKVGLERISLKRGTDQISLLVKVKEFTIDLNNLLKKLLTEALSAKKKKATDTLVLLRQDSLKNANDVGRLIIELEKNNFPLESTGATLTPLFANPVTVIDSSAFLNNPGGDKRKSSFNEIRKRKRIHNAMRHSINVAALADIIVTDPNKLKTLLDDLVKNSGELIANLILGKDSKGQEDIVKSIAVDYLNKNLDRLVSEYTPNTQWQEPLLPVPPIAPAAAPAFDATKYLYISSQVQFANSGVFIKQLEDALRKRNTYAFINYSQDVSTEAYLARAKGAKPKGLPQGVKYKVYTLVNIPGSIMEQVVSSGSSSTATSAQEAIKEGVFEGDKAGAMKNSAAFASFKQKLIDEIGAGYSGFTCFGDAFDRYNEVNDRYNSEAIAFYAGAMKFWLCATEKENCNVDNQFKCGFTNGLLQELDWLTLVDAVSEFEITKEDIKEVLLCLANDIPIGTHPSNPTFEDAVFKCITGISLTGLKDGINEFVKENWTEPYYQGQATVFALTLISPFKAGIVKKLNKLTKYSSKITKFETLAKATNADELIAASKKVAKGERKLWTKIDELTGDFQGKVATYYDVNVTYQSTRVRAGVAFEQNGILEFHLKIPDELQGQGIGSEIFKRAISDYSPSKVKGWWKQSDIYTGGESINLKVFKEKVASGMKPLDAVFETPTGKILKDNGFNGVPEIIKDTPEEVIIHFNPK